MCCDCANICTAVAANILNWSFFQLSKVASNIYSDSGVNVNYRNYLKGISMPNPPLLGFKYKHTIISQIIIHNNRSTLILSVFLGCHFNINWMLSVSVCGGLDCAGLISN